MRFRSKPRIIEAVRFDPEGEHRTRLPTGVVVVPTLPVGSGWRYATCTAHDELATVLPGDWIVKEPDGRGHYPVKPDIFERTYEPVEETT